MVGGAETRFSAATSSFRDAPSWAQTRNPAPCTAQDSGFARPAQNRLRQFRAELAPRNDGRDLWTNGAGMLVAGLNVSELLELAVLLVAVGALAGFLAGVFGIGGGAILVPVFYE